jgi:hypothetical protein
MIEKKPPVFIGCRLRCNNGHLLLRYEDDDNLCPQRDKCPHGSSEGKEWFKANKGVYQQ